VFARGGWRCFPKTPAVAHHDCHRPVAGIDFTVIRLRSRFLPDFAHQPTGPRLHIYTRGGGGVRGNNTPVSFTLQHRHRHQRPKRLYSRAPAALVVVVAAVVSKSGGGDICVHGLVERCATSLRLEPVYQKSLRRLHPPPMYRDHLYPPTAQLTPLLIFIWYIVGGYSAITVQLRVLANEVTGLALE
jgi:hypothetical protein